MKSQTAIANVGDIVLVTYDDHFEGETDSFQITQTGFYSHENNKYLYIFMEHNDNGYERKVGILKSDITSITNITPKPLLNKVGRRAA